MMLQICFEGVGIVIRIPKLANCYHKEQYIK